MHTDNTIHMPRMEDNAFPYRISIDASQPHAHMHFQTSSLAVEPAIPLPPPHPLFLHPQYDPPEPVSPPSLPLSYTHGSRHPSHCAQESCATTDSISVHDEHNSHTHKTDDKVDINRKYDGVELNLSLGSGGHQEHGMNSRVTSEMAEHGASCISELDRSSHGVAAAELSHSAPLLTVKSSEGAPWPEDVISGRFDHRPAVASESDQSVGDFDELCPTAKGHSVFQVRLDTSRAFPFSTGALPADEAFPLSVGAVPADGALVASHEEKVFFCKFCDRRFHSSQALGGHQNAHKRERLVARSSPSRFGPPPPIFCAVPGAMSFDVPSCSMQQHLVGAGRDRRPVPYPLSASMCRDGFIAPLPRLQDTAACRDNFEAPLLPSMPSTKLILAGSPSSNLYVENRSLGIKAHSLVHKPSTGHSFAPRMGHLKAINVIPAPDRASATHHVWSSRTASMDAQLGVARCLALTGQDHHVQHKNLHHEPTRFSLHIMKDETASLLRHHRQCMPFHESYVHPLANHSNPVKPCIKSGFLYELDSSSSIVDLALHL